LGDWRLSAFKIGDKGFFPVIKPSPNRDIVPTVSDILYG
jgi:hypothetical protein